MEKERKTIRQILNEVYKIYKKENINQTHKMLYYLVTYLYMYNYLNYTTHKEIIFILQEKLKKEAKNEN